MLNGKDNGSLLKFLRYRFHELAQAIAPFHCHQAENYMNYKADTIYYSNDQADMDESCEVCIDGSRIIVSYHDDEGPVKYIGNEIGVGHFELKCAERKGHATLHQFPNGNILEGFWNEDGERGMWRLRPAE